MPVPDFQSMMLPLLEVLGDAETLTAPQVRDLLAARLKLSAEDVAALLPSGGQSQFANRSAWATFHLTKAALVERAGRGVYRITASGREVLARRLAKIDIAFLSEFKEFVEWRGRKTGPDVDGEEPEPPASGGATPEEQIAAGYRAIRGKVESDLIDRILAASPSFFERLVVELLVAMGYGGSQDDAGQALGRSGDGGLDGIIKEDRLGLDAVYVQAKRWALDRSVGRPEIQAFAGSLEGERARKGVFITTSSFSREAEDYVKRIEKKIVLVDGKRLAALMLEFNVGVRDKQSYVLKEVDDDYFIED